ncbi:hypothetical protein [Weissella confusa]|uniref:hypothetical protein n=1 Tax=Weissella confusa TaxID=1583 RepID=UPI000E47A29B|nr:hypothetical protein [Weissella confusa]MBF7055251.1 hypothetical protein [Weissella confusa]MBJ7652471.1 YfhO family protein [Weissella confusa]MBJ7681429.1 YfhO family protein [Weissella confusa]MBJ7683662.1 YfhO family protein [Weissella confusa]MBJ7702256.1 YfhO family protein [Weissella confusa]
MHILRKLSKNSVFWIGIIAIIETLLFFKRGYFSIAGNDLSFQFTRIESLVNAFSHGEWPGLVSFWGNSNTGAAINGMYPWLTSMLFVIPRLVFAGHVYFGWMVGIAIVQFLSGLTMFVTVKRMFSRNGVGFMAGVLYMSSAYHLILIYQRFALAEFLAYSFVPLVFLGLYQILDGDRHGKYTLALGMALIINTHMLTAVTVIPFGALYVLLMWTKKHPNWQQIIEAFKAVLMTIIMMLAVLVPMLIISQKNHILMQQKFWGIDASAVDLVGAGKEAITFNLFGTSSPWTWHLDIVILAVFVIAIIAWLVQLFRGKEKVLSESTILALLAIFAAILPSNVVDWSLLEKFGFALIQFPGRLLTYSGFFIIIFAASVFVKLNNKAILTSFISVSAVVVAVISINLQVNRLQERGGLQPDINNIVTAKSSFLDYSIMPTGMKDKEARIFADTVANNQVSDKYDIVAKNVKSNELGMTINVKNAGEQTLPVFVYKGVKYKVRVDGSVQPVETKQGLLTVHADKIGETAITISAVTPAWLIIVDVLTLISIGFVLYKMAK